ncbi:MAG TPA: hypothetical protein VKH37_02585, partial [Ferruginibacter sp.]|nr:hypothetical protein [Ferruginibacter sp.]
YLNKGDSVKAEQTMQIVMQTKYDNDYFNEYKKYVLSEYYLRKGNEKLALDYLEKITDADLKSYAATDPSFKSLFSNERFKKIVKSK